MIDRNWTIDARIFIVALMKYMGEIGSIQYFCPLAVFRW